VKPLWWKTKPPEPEYDDDEGTRVEIRVYFKEKGHLTEIVVKGYLDELNIDTDTWPVNYDNVRTEFIPFNKTFKMTGKVRPWKEKDRDRPLR